MTDHLDVWAAHSPLAGHALDQVTVDFLLPTGIYIQMDVPREATIQHIKLVSVVAHRQDCITHTQTLSKGCFDRAAVVVGWEYFLWFHLSLWANKPLMTS